MLQDRKKHLSFHHRSIIFYLPGNRKYLVILGENCNNKGTTATRRDAIFHQAPCLSVLTVSLHFLRPNNLCALQEI